MSLTQLAVDCIRKFTSVDYEIWVIDNLSKDGTVEWLKQQKDVNVILNKTGTHSNQKGESEFSKVQYQGSWANAVGLELSRQVCQTKWMFVMHNDAVPCAPRWLEKFLSKTSDRIRGVTTRKDPGRIHAMHVSGMLFDYEIFQKSGMNFAHNMPNYDVGDAVTIGIEKEGYECFFFRNTFNDPELLNSDIWRGHWLENFSCDKSIDDNFEPFYLHLGRGTALANSKVPMHRKTSVNQWIEQLKYNLFGDAYTDKSKSMPQINIDWLDKRSYSLRRWYVDQFCFRNMGCYLPKTKVLNLGGHKGTQRGQFKLESYEYEVTTFNISIEKGADVLGDAAHMPFADEIYNVVFCSEVLEHIKDIRLVLSECYRVLKPGGELVGCTPFLYRIHADPYDHARYTGEHLKICLKEAGFYEIQVEAQGGLFSVIIDFIRQFYYFYKKTTTA